MKYRRSSLKYRGFTLIELLVSVAIFMTVSVIVIAVLFSSFRLSKKSDSIISLKQSGDIALLQMSRNIKYAKSLDNPISCITPVTQSSITITSAQDDGQTIYSCPTKKSPLIASNGASLIDNTAVINSCSFTCSQATINDPPTITIKFVLSTLKINLVESAVTTEFQTSVVMRNYSR